MIYNIRTNYFSKFIPKVRCCDCMVNNIGVHAICYPLCNFNCQFCNNTNHPKENYKVLSVEKFEQTIRNALVTGKVFKFTGGEPTTNPFLCRDMRIVSDLGGKVLLDTNGSNPKVVGDVMSNIKVDTVGVSLKGLTPIQAMKTSNSRSSIMCWENVFETISCCSSYLDTKVIVTMVFHDDMGSKEIVEFAGLMESYSGVYLKFNNLLLDQRGLSEFKPLPRGKLQQLLRMFVSDNPQWIGRCFIVDEINAVRDNRKIIFM